MNSARARGIVALLTASLLTSGCSLHPVALSESAIDRAALKLRTEVAAEQEPVAGAITLHQAMARALKYNLDYYVEQMQTQLRSAELNVAHAGLLPGAVATAAYTGRSNMLASSSENAFTHLPSLVTSTSSDQRLRTRDMVFSWNILDFGLSYVKARQASDKVLIGEELQRKAMHHIIEDVRSAYWRAVSSERLLRRLTTLERRARTALANSREIARSRQVSLITALTYQRELVEVQRTARELRRELIVAKSQLAALMNVPPTTSFTLVLPDRSARVPELKLSAETMIGMALRGRSEVRENLYLQRINVQETHAALLELLPGLNVFAGPNYDSNSFALNNDWVSWGAKATWNVVRVFQYPARREAIEAQQTLLEARAKALAMAIMTQVHVSRVRYLHLAGEVAIANDYLTVQRQLLGQVRAEAQADRVSEQTVIREELNTLVAEARFDIAFSGLQNAYAGLVAAVGLDPVEGPLDRSRSLAEIAGQLRTGLGLGLVASRRLEVAQK